MIDAQATKFAVWGEPISLDDDTRDFYLAKYDENGNVRPGWSHAEWTRARMRRAMEFNR